MNTIIEQKVTSSKVIHSFESDKYYEIIYEASLRKQTAMFIIKNDNCYFAKLNELEIRPDIISIQHIFDFGSSIKISTTTKELFDEFVSNFIIKFI